MLTEHSRHIYDLYKLYQSVAIDDDLKVLFHQVREDRKAPPACLSARESVSIPLLLKEIIDKEIYKNDYETITQSLLFEKVSYNVAINAVEAIRQSNLFR